MDETTVEPHEKPRPSRVRRWGRRALFGVLGLVGLVLAIVLGAYIALQTRGGRALLLDKLAPVLSTAIPGKIVVGSIEEARLGRIVLRNVVIEDPRGDEVIRVGEAYVRMRYGALFRGNIHIASVVAKDVRVVLRTTDEGSLTLVDAFVTPEPEPTPDTASVLEVLVETARISRGRVIVDVLDDPPIELRDVAISGQVHVTDDVRVTVHALSFRSVRGATPLLDTRGLRASYRSGPDQTTSLSARLRGGEDAIAIDASMRNPSNENAPFTETRVAAHVALAPLTTRLLAAFDQQAIGEDVPSRVHADIRVAGRLDRARVHGVFRVDDETLELTGGYRAEGESHVRLCTEGATLAKLFRSLPAQRLAGCFTVRMGVYDAASTPMVVSVEDARLDRAPLPDVVVTSRLSVRDERIDIVSLELPSLPDATPPRLALAGHVGFSGAMSLELSLVRFRLSEEPALAELLRGVHAVVDARVEVRVEAPPREDAPSPLRATVGATVRELRASGVTAREVRLQASANGTTEVPRLDVRAEVDALTSGDFRAKHTRLHVNGSLSSVAVDLESELPRERRVRLHAEARDGGGTWRGSASGTFGGARDPFRLAVEGASYHVESGAARVQRLVLAQGESRIEGRGGMSGNEVVEAELHIVRFAVHDALRELAMPVAGLEATLEGVLRAGGTVRTPTLEANLTLEDVKYEELEDVRAELALDYGRTEASLDATIALEALGELTVDADMTWGRPMPLAQVIDHAEIDVNVGLDALDLAVLQKVAPTAAAGVGGKLSGNITVTGRTAEPAIAAALTGASLVIPGLPIQPPELEARLDASWDEALVLTLASEDEAGELLGVEARLGMPSSVLLTGRIVLSEAPFEVRATLAERPLDSLPVDVTTLAGHGVVAKATAEVRHTPGQPLSAVVDGQLRVEPDERETSAPLCGERGVSFDLSGRLDDGRSTVTLGVTIADRKATEITLAAATPVDAWLAGERTEMPTAELEGRIDSLDLAKVPVLCEYVRGTVDGTVEGQRLGSPSAVAEVRVAAPDLVFAEDAPIALNATARATSEGARAELAVEARDGGQANVTIAMPFTWGEDGLAPTVPDGPLDARARFVRFSLEPIAGITPFIRRRAGTLDGHLTVTGTLAAPVPNGEIRIHEASLMMPGLEQRLTDLEAHVSLSPTRIRVHEFRARDVRGRLSLTGEARFEGSVPTLIDVELDANDFPVRQAGVIIAEVTSRASLGLRRETDALRGELEFQRLAVKMPDELRTGVQDLEENPDIVYLDTYPPGWEPPERIEPEEAVATSEVEDESPFVPTFFHIDMSRPFWVRRSDFAIELRAELDLGVVEEGVRLSGTVHTQRGFLELIGASFDIEEGTVRFPGGTKIDPVLDLSAVANLNMPNQVRVRIKGSIADLELKFYDRAEREITAGLAVQCITTGQCTALGDFTAGNEEQAAEQQAQSALASLTVGMLTAAARHGLGEAVPRIGVSTGGGFDEVTARVGFEANRLIPEFLRGIVLSLYIEGFVGGTGSDGQTTHEGVQETSSRVEGGFLVELRHPRSLVTRGRVAPRSGFSLDVTWQR